MRAIFKFNIIGHLMIKHGTAPYLECSSKGEKRLSAFFARIKSRGNKSIEELYQAAKIFKNGETGLRWQEAKGKEAVNMEFIHTLYSALWDEYIAENPDLGIQISSAVGLSDMYGQTGHACQASELWRIRNNLIRPTNGCVTSIKVEPNIQRIQQKLF